MDIYTKISIYRSAKDNRGQVMTLAEFMAMGKDYAARIVAYRTLKESVELYRQQIEVEKKSIRDCEAVIDRGYNPLLPKPDDYRVAEETLSKLRQHVDELNALVESGRNECEKMKRSLPGATISGVFYPTRNIKNLQLHSGFICVDVDDHVNQRASDGTVLVYSQNLDNLVDVLRDLPWVLYAAHSAGGKGYFIIVPIGPIDEQHTHQWYFDCLSIEFQELGFTIDPACSDPTRLRFLSYDKHPYRNARAVEYMGRAGFVGRARQREIDEERRRQEDAARQHAIMGKDCSKQLRDAIRCVEQIEARSLDITSSYDQCIKLGKSLYELGNDGLVLWDRICRFRSNSHAQLHTYAELERKWRSFASGSMPVDIGYFFNLCKKEYNIEAWPRR